MKVTTHWNNDDILVTDEVRVATDREEFSLTAKQAEELGMTLIVAAARSRQYQD